jgi:uncharacterized protein YbgA (DUF1722 family)
VVAAAGRPPRAATGTGYRDLFTAAMFSGATRGRHANTLQHAFSRTGRDLGRGRRADLSARIESYRRGADPLSVPVALLGHYVSEGDLPWLGRGTWSRTRTRCACGTPCRADEGWAAAGPVRGR